jgi:hypothetical protein
MDAPTADDRGSGSSDDSKRPAQQSMAATGLALGIAFGAAFGSAFGNAGEGVALGMIFGLVFGSWLDSHRS